MFKLLLYMNNNKNIWLPLFIFFIIPSLTWTQTNVTSSKFTIARLKYHGGGDWYNDPSIIPNMLRFLNDNTTINGAANEVRVEIMDEALFSYPFLFMTGHGHIKFSDEEAARLRHYLTNGGFLFADDDYGMDEHFRREMKKVFPDKEIIEIPFSNKIFHNHFAFSNGLPKIHEHDGGPPKGYGYFHEGRLIVFYAFNTNIADGWADATVHGDPEQTRQQAFKMGTNIVVYALMH